VIGFDIERHVYGEHRYPAQLVVQDVTTLHGSQFKERRADRRLAAVPGIQLPGDAVEARQGAAAAGQHLFEACFRIQREACEAAGRHIPLIVENVRGAQPMGRASSLEFRDRSTCGATCRR
jgi:hypothetical protein